MVRFKLFAVLFFLCLPAYIQAGDSARALTICGSGDNQELLRQLARLYESSQPGIRVEVPDSIGSSGGVKATAQGQCDIGRLARPLRDKEKRYNLSYKVFASSPVVFIVSANLETISNITAEQVVSIFSGKIRSWRDLGGPQAKIYIAHREKGDSSRSVLEKHLIDFALIKKTVGKTIYSTPETVDIVAGHDNTIAYTSYSSVIKKQGIRVLTLEGEMANVEAIKAGKYPLYSEFGLVWRADASADALAFLEFVESTGAREIIEIYGAVPVGPETL